MKNTQEEAKDTLSLAYLDIRQWCKKMEFTLVLGTLDESSKSVRIQHDQIGIMEWQSLVGTAKDLGCSILVVRRLMLTDDDCRRLEKLEEHAEGMSSDEAEELSRVMAKAKRHQGHIGCLEIECVNQATGLVIFHSWVEEWFESAERFLDDLDDEAESDEDEQRLDAKVLKQLAERVARDPVFQGAKSQHRMHAAQSILVAAFPENERDQDELVRSASAIYDVDIRPQEERALRERIRELQKQGLSKPKIAMELGITTKKLSVIAG